MLNKDQIIVLEPWPGATKPQVFKLTEIPEKIVVTSTTHLPYLEMLDVDKSLIGFPNTQYIYSPGFRSAIESGRLIDLGPDGNLNIELLFSLDPDVVIAFDMGNESATLDKIQEANIPVLYNSDYLETSSLGRAEWIKFFGALFDKRKEADSIFDGVVKNYEKYKTLVKGTDYQPKVFSGVLYGDAWFLPGGRNWSSQFISDAGGEYLWQSDSSSGWMELSFESVYSKAFDADYWIGTSTFNSLDELASQDSRYRSFHAFAERKVYSYNLRRSPGGGFDYFESGYSRPDLVLADIIKILHPQRLQSHEFHYFTKLK